MSNNDYVNGKIVFNDVRNSEEHIYQEVLDDFINAKNIYISTYSLGKTEVLIKYLKKKKDVNVTLITNIVSRFNKDNKDNEKGEEIDKYIKMLEIDKFKNIELYFNKYNHTKIVATENILYLGSQNFTYGSIKNYEIGVIIKDKEDIDKIIEKFNIIKDESVKWNNNRYIQIRDGLAKEVIQLEHILSNITNIISDTSLDEINKYIKNSYLFYGEFLSIIQKIINDKLYKNYSDAKYLDEELLSNCNYKEIEDILDSKYSNLLIYNKIIKDENLNDDNIDKYIKGYSFDYENYIKDLDVCIDCENIYLNARTESYIVTKFLKELLNLNRKSIDILEKYIYEYVDLAKLNELYDI